MIFKNAASLALAGGLMLIASLPAANAQRAGITRVTTNRPQTNPGDTSATWSPAQNVVASKQYERLLRTNP